MAVDRRSAIKQLLFVSAGLAILPSCLQKTTRSSMAIKNFSIDADQEKILAELTDTIIPPTSTPGAKSLGAPLFTVVMLDDCYTKDEQKRWVKGLKAFEDACKDMNGKGFVQCNTAQRDALVKSLEESKEDNALNYFYRTTKRETIHAYTTSKYFLTNVDIYELVPGRYKGAVPYKPQARKLS
jgi:hypothetical protein